MIGSETVHCLNALGIVKKAPTLSYMCVQRCNWVQIIFQKICQRFLYEPLYMSLHGGVAGYSWSDGAEKHPHREVPRSAFPVLG
jgi:hypothetical protein